MLDNNGMSPKYFQLKRHLLDRIQRGELVPGQQLDTENVLAKQFKLSRQTVRQALGELEKEGWIVRQQGRGTFISDQKRKPKPVGLIIKSISNYTFPDIVRGIENRLNDAGFELKLYLSQDDPEREAECLQKVLENGIDGLIIEPAKSIHPCRNLHLYQEITKRQIPCLFIHDFWKELEPAYLVLDDCQGGYLATQYLLDLGHRRIAGIFNIESSQGVERQAGYRKALNEYGIEPEPGLIGEYSYKSDFVTFPFHFMSELLERPQHPTAVFCYNDMDAVRALDAIRQKGLKVPDDISIIGYNDSGLTTVSEVKLTSVKHPKRDLGIQAASLIISMVKRRIEKPRLIIQPELIIRSSCRRI